MVCVMNDKDKHWFIKTADGGTHKKIYYTSNLVIRSAEAGWGVYDPSQGLFLALLIFFSSSQGKIYFSSFRVATSRPYCKILYLRGVTPQTIKFLFVILTVEWIVNSRAAEISSAVPRVAGLGSWAGGRWPRSRRRKSRSKLKKD